MLRAPLGTRFALLAAVAVAAGLVVSACGDDDRADPSVDPAQVDAVRTPELGACRRLTPEDVAQPTDATRTVDCHQPHTAETFAVGTLPHDLAGVARTSSRLDAFADQTCADDLRTFVGADDSLVMRTVVSWAWFRPSQQAWDDGARWYRCDVIGGGQDSTRYVDLPTTARNLLAGPRPPDRWTVCVDGPSVQTSPKIPCSRPHTWRAVTAIKVGDPGDPYPGDAAVESKTHDYCSSYVGAWLGYPDSYDFGYTWFHAAEWRAGNRRSVCWAKTTA